MAEQLTDRAKRILEAVIEDYIATAEPVGSRPITRVQVPDRVEHRQVFGVFFEDFLILSDGVLQFSLLNRLLRRGEDLCLVETETKSH